MTWKSEHGDSQRLSVTGTKGQHAVIVAETDNATNGNGLTAG